MLWALPAYVGFAGDVVSFFASDASGLEIGKWVVSFGFPLNHRQKRVKNTHPSKSGQPFFELAFLSIGCKTHPKEDPPTFEAWHLWDSFPTMLICVAPWSGK